MSIIKQLWDELKKTTLKYQEKDDNIIFNDNVYDEFEHSFTALYNKIKERYMRSDINALDNHKIAAVFIVTVENVNVISYKKDLDKYHFFIGSEMFVTETALNFMLHFFNNRLEELELGKVDQYYMPNAFACNTPYFEIFSRNIFYSKEEKNLNVLNLAENLFLIEYITLLKNDINPQAYYQ